MKKLINKILDLKGGEFFEIGISKNSSEGRSLLSNLRQKYQDNLFIIDGKKLNDVGVLHEALSNILHLPDYYGHNWDALYDVLTDLTWLKTSQVILLISDHDRVLEAESDKIKEIFFKILRDAATESSLIVDSRLRFPDQPKLSVILLSSK